MPSQATRSDEELIRQIASRGPAGELALTELHTRYARRFFARLMKSGVPPSDAEGIVNTLFFDKVWQQTERLLSAERLMPYLWRTLDNLGLDYLRARSRDPVFVEIGIPGLTDCPDIAVEESSEERELCVEKAFRSFRAEWPERGDVIYLATVEEWNLADVAEYIGRSYGATRQFLYESRKRLKNLIVSLCGELLED